ncbi:hypothetical protein FHX63_005558 [Cupriavidus plantarum]|nr:hypothetical protein [Cupriavidus plantarum]
MCVNYAPSTGEFFAMSSESKLRPENGVRRRGPTTSSPSSDVPRIPELGEPCFGIACGLRSNVSGLLKG